MTLQEFADKWRARPIRDAASAREFVVDCEASLGLGFHPDTRFTDYVTRDASGAFLSTFTEEDGETLDTRLDEAFSELGQVGEDVYEISLTEMYRNHPELRRD